MNHMNNSRLTYSTKYLAGACAIYTYYWIIKEPLQYKKFGNAAIWNVILKIILSHPLCLGKDLMWVKENIPQGFKKILTKLLPHNL